MWWSPFPADGLQSRTRLMMNKVKDKVDISFDLVFDLAARN